MDRRQAAIDLLMAEGGPTLRYLTASEILKDSRLTVQLRRAWRDDLVSTWVSALNPDLPIHGGNDDTFETVTGKLFELGAHKDSLPLVKRMSGYLEALNHEPKTMLDNLYQVLIGSAAARLGFDVGTYARRRLRDLHSSIRKFGFDIYRPRDSYTLPKRCKPYPVVRESLASNGVFRLPYVHDLYLLNNVELSTADRRRYRDVVSYVLDPRYQHLPHGFGYVEERLKGRSRFLVVGWKADFDGSLIRMELDASLPPGLRSKPDLSKYADSVGWSFPRESLVDKSPGYWVVGQRMALTPSPRRARERKLESTFRALRLKNE